MVHWVYNYHHNNDIIVYNLPENNVLKSSLVKSQFILPDGQPIIWASRLLLEKAIVKRLPGSDIFPLMWEKAIVNNISILLLLPNDVIAAKLKAEYPSAYTYVLPFFQKDDRETIMHIVRESVDLILKNKIKLIMIGVTFPKQNLIAVGITAEIKMRNLDYKNYLIGMIGASFEFYLGIKSRAPLIYRKVGMEWLHRFFSEPKRLFKRYFIDSWHFIPIVFQEWKKSGRR